MAIPLHKKLVEYVLLGSSHDRRQLQDSPILGDVWLAFGERPDGRRELLIEPHWQRTAGEVANQIHERVEEGAEVAPLHGIVAADLRFEEVLRVVMPMSSWWQSERIRREANVLLDERYSDAAQTRRARLYRVLARILDAVRGVEYAEPALEHEDQLLPALDRFIALASLILWAGRPGTTGPVPAGDVDIAAVDAVDAMLYVLQDARYAWREEPIVWQISLNRTAIPALVASVPSVKADAARLLFGVDCSAITWAVIDSGIQGDHPAFLDAQGNSRVVRSFDFTRIRRIVSLDNLRPQRRQARVGELLHPALRHPPRDDADAVEKLEMLAEDAKRRRAVHWDLVLPFVEIDPATRPQASDHGTHVAGIIGAAKQPAHPDGPSGLCPEIQLFDFRVLAPNVRETEFAIIAALQFIRWLNERTDYMAVHGANLSLSIPHDVRNYACGRTPICLECERLVDSGVLVVAAAGNLGYQNFTTRDGSYDGYAAFSVTDPGNADGVLTVGATHRSAPHTYGVSFFSSRGPTGDGRAKPDLVAPGERIRGPLRDGWGDLDGTSMAAPHVSGAAAMLMARYAEMIGQPRRVKRILCESATDLGREKSFQGHGMLDVLRAFQSI